MKIKLDKYAFVPVREHITDAGLDIRAIDDGLVRAKQSLLFHTGVHVQLPKGTAGLFVSKSGLMVKHGITSTGLVDKRNLRNMIDMSRQRMCNRAYWEFRQMFSDICDALSAYCAENGEWETIVRTQLYPKCEPSKTCPEAHGCGKYPKVGGR